MVPGHGDGIWGSLFRTATLTWAKVMGGMTRTKPVRANSCVIQSAAIDAFALVQGGTPVTFGFGGLEALPDGRLIGARSRGALELYEILPDPSLGTAEVAAIAVSWPSLAGTVNGLESELRTVVPSDLLARVQELVDSGYLAANKSKSLIARSTPRRL